MRAAVRAQRHVEKAAVVSPPYFGPPDEVTHLRQQLAEAKAELAEDSENQKGRESQSKLIQVPVGQKCAGVLHSPRAGDVEYPVDSAGLLRQHSKQTDCCNGFQWTPAGLSCVLGDQRNRFVKKT